MQLWHRAHVSQLKTQPWGCWAVVYACLGYGRLLWFLHAPWNAFLRSFKKRRLRILSPQSQPHFTPVGSGPLLGGGKCGLDFSRLKKGLKPDFSLCGPALSLTRFLIKCKRCVHLCLGPRFKKSEQSSVPNACRCHPSGVGSALWNLSGGRYFALQT